DPFGPTTQVMPGSNRSDVVEAKDLNPRRVRLFTYTRGLSSPPLMTPPAQPHRGPGIPPMTRTRRSASLSAPYRERPTVPVISRVIRQPCRAGDRPQPAAVPRGRPEALRLSLAFNLGWSSILT